MEGERDLGEGSERFSKQCDNIICQPSQSSVGPVNEAGKQTGREPKVIPTSVPEWQSDKTGRDVLRRDENIGFSMQSQKESGTI